MEDLGGRAKAHFEDEHLSRHFLPDVMREDVMREEAGVLRLALRITRAARLPLHSENYG